MLAGSAEMQSVFAMIRRVAKSTAPVLILGESGTGKEMVANAIHRQSDRKDKPFIAINCSAIPENLIESELFGHEKGTFTGADKQRKGLIEGAAGGTLFLDEIGDLPAPVQVKLLRFLQDKCLMRVGGREEFKIDTRVVAATNAELEQSVKDGKFREDLYFRLAVVVLNLPPLRERGDDAAILAQAFLGQFADENGKDELVFTPETLRAIGNFAWPGNVRELQNRVQRAVIMAEGKRISIADMELAAAGSDAANGETLKEAKERVERQMVEQALATHAGKITAAAKALGVSRPTFYELMDKLGISKDA
jgi:two-component system NtrC family response regulator